MDKIIAKLDDDLSCKSRSKRDEETASSEGEESAE